MPPIATTCDNPLCGKEFLYERGYQFHLYANHYCSRSCRNRKHGPGASDAHISYSLWDSAKRRANRRGILFTLTLADMPPIPRTCPVLGIPIRKTKKAESRACSPSMDRIIPELGYVAGNVRIISFRANNLKNNASVYELLCIAHDACIIEQQLIDYKQIGMGS